MVGLALGSAAAGLVGSPHCVGMCGGFASACSLDVPGTVAWHAGRLVTYAVLGAAAGALGGALPLPSGVATVLSVVLLAWFAAGLAGIVRAPHVVVPGLVQASRWFGARAGVLPRFAFGACAGLLPCGLLYGALAVPIAAGGAVPGALAMVAFGLGTVPALAFASTALRRVVDASPWRRRALAGAVLVIGVGSLAVRASGTPEHPACHEAAP
jgi:sulfite exporter TauE/SafE